MRPLVVILAVLATVPSASAASAAERPFAGAPPLAADGGRVAFSVPDGHDRWRLALLDGGAVRTLPVPARATPFDVSLGTDARGRPAAVYSRCRVGPRGTTIQAGALEARASGCDLYEIALAGGRERPLPVPGGAAFSDRAPALSGGEVLFARRIVPGRDVLELRRRDGTLVPMPGGSRQTCPFRRCPPGSIVETVMATALGPRAAAFTWLMYGGNAVGAAATELWAVRRPSGSRTLLDAGHVSGACGYRVPASPAVLGADVGWLRWASPCAGDTGRVASSSTPWSRRLVTGALDPFPLALAIDRRTGLRWWIALPGLLPASGDVHTLGDCAQPSAGCSLRSARTVAPATPETKRVTPPLF